MALPKVTGELVDIGDLDISNVGSIQLDSIAGDADSNTSITFSGSDVITVATGGTTALTIDANQKLTANSGVAIDNITIDGTEIDLSSGSLTVDVAGDIYLDADGGDIVFKDGGTDFGEFSSASNNLTMKSSISDADIKFNGNDGGSAITALTLDMSDAGTATFNHDVNVGGDVNLTAGALSITGDGSNAVTFTESGAGIMTIATPDYFLVDSADDIILDADGADIRFRDGGAGFFTITNSSLDAVLKVEQSNEDLLIKGNDGGTEITALTLDMSDAGKAKFNGSIIIEKNSRVLEIADAAIQWYSYETSDYKSALFRADDYSFKNAGNTVVASINSSGAITASSHITLPAASRLYLDGGGNTFIEETSADMMTFTCNNTEHLRINSNGNINIGIGGSGGDLLLQPLAKLYLDAGGDTYIVESSGNEVDIYTGGARRLRVNQDGLIFNTDTAAANALDDYEEGTHDPTVLDEGGGATYTLNNSYSRLAYTKVGRLVTVTGTIVISGVSGTASGTTSLSLPFACANLSEQSGKSGGAGVGYYQVEKYTSGDFPQTQIGEGGSKIYLYYGTVDGNQLNTKFTSSTQLYFQVSYFTA